MSDDEARAALDEDAVIACADLVGRTGATGFLLGYLDDDPAPRDWYAYAQYRGARISVDGQPGQVEAADALSRRLLDGATCKCGKPVALADTDGACRWTRNGRRWISACGRGRDKPDPEPVMTAVTHPTARKLADALRPIPGVPAAMIRRAEQGYYHDFASPLDFPLIQLVTDLRALIDDPTLEPLARSSLRELIDQVMAGEYDATAAEADAWARSAEGQATFAELLKGRKRRRS